MATITKLPLGKYRAQIRRQGIYWAQSFSRKIDAQRSAVEIERAIEGGQSRGLMRPATGMTLNDIIEAYSAQVGKTFCKCKGVAKMARVTSPLDGYLTLANTRSRKTHRLLHKGEKRKLISKHLFQNALNG